MLLFQIIVFGFAVWLIWELQIELYRKEISHDVNMWKAGIKRFLYGILLVLLALLYVYGMGASNNSYYKSEQEAFGDIEHYEPKW